jgi:FtsP/CotA-like multicopper oxidase with cupredoxin domain
MLNFNDKRIRTHLVVLSVLLTPFVLYGIYAIAAQFLLTPSLEGIHAMADGTVMNAKGEVIEGAHVMPDGSIMLANGKVVGTIHLGTRFSTSVDELPFAKEEPEMVVLSNGDSFELTAGYVKKEVGNRTLRMLAYNGSVPGPIIKAEQGAEITINFNNNTDIEQTIHSHGVRIDNRFDGVPDSTQKAVPPGESFAYTVKFDDAGVYWYHPHTREDYAQELGLYGNYIVEPSERGYWSQVNREVPLIVDDILIDNDKIASFYEEITNFALLGRFGNEHLVNGEVGYDMEVKKGEVIRFFITNVANARTYNLSIPGARLKRVGADLGRYERETFEEAILISPAERLVVEVFFPEAGTYELLHTSPNGSVSIATFIAEGNPDTSYEQQFNALRENASVAAEFEPLKKYRYAAPAKELLLTVALSGPKIDHSKHVHMLATSSVQADGFPNLQWDDVGATDMTNTTEKVDWILMDTDTRKQNMEIDDWNFKIGDLVKIQIENDPNAEHVMQHPIHFHGQRFIVLDRNGVPNENMVWKDTTLIEPGEVVNILVEMSNSGEWMTHCHIAEHLHAGMMLSFRVENQDGSATGDAYRQAHGDMKH